MSNHELEIIMKLKDEVSKRLQGIEGALHRFANKAQSVGQALKQLGRDISQIGSSLTIMGAALTGPLALAFKTADKYSNAVHNQVERLKSITDQLQISLATALVPIIERLTNILAALLNIWNSLGPVVQQQIVQGVFLTGVFLTFGGVIIGLIGRIMRLSGVVATLFSGFMKLVLLHPVLAAIIGLISVIVVLMFRFKGVADVVLSTLEVLFMFFLNGLQAVRVAFARIVAFILGGLEKIYAALGKIPGPVGRMHQAIAESIHKMREEMDKFGDTGVEKIAKNSERIGKIFSEGEGEWSKGFDKFKIKISNIWDLLKNPPKVDIKPIQERFDYLKNIADSTFRAMERAYSDFFYNSIINKSFKIKDFFGQLGQSILRIWTDTLAKMITRWMEAQITMQKSGGSSSGGWLNIIGNIAGIFAGMGGGAKPGASAAKGSTSTASSPRLTTLHMGGPVRPVYAHHGLSMDEALIIGKRGEYMLSEKGVAAAGGMNNVERLNRGEGSFGSITLQPTVIIQAIDTQTGTEFIMKNSDKVGKAIIAQILKDDIALRGAIAKYGRK